ncbi:TP901 family phage tail tape measure protein [Kitasatospora sp. GAS204A]|uniref:phage tail tape measure protein n=1 Tax=unclassified Kitasatospora TaxID=2633591 RepID=UPI00247567AD|nr:phage tail tape measure protein [Kitasatospora sp. GAS204B]MDH6116916.1 TP901 family phage tail tape measure protein [Kitasatospora sp. GAS204B]
MTNVVEILVTAKNLTGPAFAEVKASGEGMSSTMDKVNKTAALAATAMIGFVGESVKMAADFDSKMSLINTQAGVSQDKMAGLKAGVLQLAGQIGQNPDSLAESLYHVESNFESLGITSEKALDITKTAAEGAAVGHANLVDVTNALTAAVASGIPGVQDMSQAMGVLNATVGVGDMSMQDLVKAFGSGMVATVKGFGLSISDVGAALAVFGDNNIRGANAGTQLRMSVMALANPLSTAGATLEKLGLKQDTLAKDMQQGGLKLALEDLTAHLQQAGVTADQQGQVITDAFGRKAGAGLNVLLSQMDRLESKYPALAAGANGFGDAWAATQKTFSQQMKELQGSVDALMISIGEKMLPVLGNFVQALLDHKQAVLQVGEAVSALIGVLAGFAAINKVVGLVTNLTTAFKDAGTALVAYKARVAEAQAASELAGGGITKLGAAFSALSLTGKLTLAMSAIGLVVLAVQKLQEVSTKAPPSINGMTTALGNFSEKAQTSGVLAQTFGANLQQLGYAVDRVAGKASGMDAFNDAMNKIFSFGMAQSNSMKQAKDQINALDQGLANLVQGGHADQAAQALTDLQNALAKQGKNPDELSKELTQYNQALGAAALEQKLAAESMGALGTQAEQTNQLLQQQTLDAQGLKDAIISLNDANRSALDSMAGFEQSIADASKAATDNGHALKYSGDQLDLTTDSARNEEKALSDLAAKTDAAAEAALNNGESMDTVNQIYGQGRDKLIALAQQMGLTKDQAKDLADQILSTPDKTAELKGDISDLQQKIATAQQQLAAAPSSKKVQISAEISDLQAQLADAQAQIDALTGKTVTITTHMVTFNDQQYGHGGPGSYAHGGIIGAAGGGPRSGMTWVGEQGPELVRLPYGSTVIPAGQSAGMAAAAAGGGRGGAVQLEWVGGNAGDEFMSWLRKNIRIRGGNVQTALGS